MSENSIRQNKNSVFRIIIATDTHLGNLENDEIRGDDSFNSFEEIWKISKSENADFLLFGWGMFHHHNLSKKNNNKNKQIVKLNILDYVKLQEINLEFYLLN